MELACVDLMESTWTHWGNEVGFRAPCLGLPTSAKGRHRVGGSRGEGLAEEARVGGLKWSAVSPKTSNASADLREESGDVVGPLRSACEGATLRPDQKPNVVCGSTACLNPNPNPTRPQFVHVLTFYG